MADPAVVVVNTDLVAAATKLVEFTTHVTAALIATQGIQVAKSIPWLPLSETSSSRVKSAVNIVVAMFTSLGITIGFTQVPVTDVAGHLRYVIDITGLASVSIWTHLWHFVEELAMQQGMYSGLIKAKAVTGTPLNLNAPPVPVVPVQP